jgi:hypothetical protein
MGYYETINEYGVIVVLLLFNVYRYNENISLVCNREYINYLIGNNQIFKVNNVVTNLTSYMAECSGNYEKILIGYPEKNKTRIVLNIAEIKRNSIIYIKCPIDINNTNYIILQYMSSYNVQVGNDIITVFRFSAINHNQYKIIDSRVSSIESHISNGIVYINTDG